MAEIRVGGRCPSLLNQRRCDQGAAEAMARDVFVGSAVCVCVYERVRSQESQRSELLLILFWEL